MRILVAGAGPAGLYFSYLFKRKNPDCELRVIEQNRADAVKVDAAYDEDAARVEMEKRSREAGTKPLTGGN